MNSNSFENIIQQGGVAIRRFPWVVASATLGSFALIIITREKTPDDIGDYIRFILSSLLGIPLFFTLALISEQLKLDFQKRIIAELIGLSLLVAYFIFLPDFTKDIPYYDSARLALWLISLHLTVSFAPYWYFSRHVTSFWHFNEQIFLRILMSILYSQVLYYGLIISLLSIDFLFHVKIEPYWYIRLWIVSVGILQTILFLAGVPKEFESLEANFEYPKPLKIFTQYVLLPLVTIYLLILYAYALKILVQWNLPHGFVSTLILIFAIAGIFSLLLIYPIQDQLENTWMRWYGKAFYIAQLPLVGLLLLAIYRRIKDYGITEPRYFVILLGIWLLGVSLYFIFSKAKNIKLIPVSLALVLFLSSFGPLSMFSISEISQKNRFKGLIDQNKIIQNKRIVPVSEKVSPLDKQSMTSIIRFFAERDRLIVLDDILNIKTDSLFRKKQSTYDKESIITGLLGINLNAPDQMLASQKKTFTLNATNNSLHDVKGYDYTYEVNFFSSREDSSLTINATEDIGIRTILLSKQNKLKIFFEEEKSETGKEYQLLLEIPLEQFAEKFWDKYKSDKEEQNQFIPLNKSSDMTLIHESKSLNVQIKFSSIEISLVNNRKFVSNFRGQVCLRKNEIKN